MLLDYLIKTYEAGEPIFSVDIEVQGMSDTNLRQQLKKLVDMGMLNRFEQGVYYFPKQSRLKGVVGPSSDIVARSKYIARRGERIGYYSGHTFANHIGISTQVPIKEEIVSNNMSAIVREVMVGTKTYIVRRPIVTVTNENYMILQLLDLLKDLEKYMDNEPEIVRKQLVSYIIENHITRNAVDKYIKEFPIKIYKTIYDMGLDNVLTRG